jgi:hypothetical protein
MDAPATSSIAKPVLSKMVGRYWPSLHGDDEG